MEFTQKRFANNIKLTFGDTELTYWIRDNSGEREEHIDYANLPHSSRKVFEKNIWLRNVGLIWCVLGVISIGLAIAGSRAWSGSGLWLLLGACCLAFYRFSQTSYTVLDTSEGPIYVMEDKQHDDIMHELTGRRVARLFKLYGAFNADNSIEQERQKYAWLVKEKVISREEADLRLAEAGDQARIIDTPGRLLN
ncbi:MAG TPA: hypothetical protein PKM48_09245 [Parvularculaceae bacterium]|nr:hypothetical protein [Parvularculaceae bacterium]HNS85368.1 hypothetical protein [Parvularculaceae bacterium]